MQRRLGLEPAAGVGFPPDSSVPAARPPAALQGLLDSRSPGKAKQLTFELFFPRPPYRGAQYRAARGKVGTLWAGRCRQAAPGAAGYGFDDGTCLRGARATAPHTPHAPAGCPVQLLSLIHI